MKSQQDYRALADELYDALDEADDRHPRRVNGDRFLAQLPMADVVSIGILSLTLCHMFPLRAVWNYRARCALPLPFEMAASTVYDERLNALVRVRRAEPRETRDILSALKHPDDLHESDDLARAIAIEALGNLDHKARPQLLVELGAQGGYFKGRRLAAGALIRAFEIRKLTAHEKLRQIDVVDKALQLAAETFPA